MSNMPSIIIKIMQYVAELNSLNKLHLNQGNGVSIKKTLAKNS